LTNLVFSVSLANFINTVIIAAGIGICGLCIMHISSAAHLGKEIRRYFQLFFSLILLYITAHLARQIMDGIPGEGVRTALYIVTFVELLAAGFMAYLMSLLVLSVTRPEKTGRAVFTMLNGIIFLHVFILGIGCFSDLIYTFDEMNVYHRGAGYLMSNLCPVVMLILNAVLLIRYRDRVSPRVRVAFWIYMLAPLIAIAIQSFSYSIQLIILATVGAAVYMFSVIVHNQNEKYAKQQLESSRLETELNMASNIQSSMLPSIYPAFPERPEFDIYASMDPAKEVGGDFYDFFLIDDDHLGLVMADVSGKGVPAALFMMASKIIIANNAKIGKDAAQVLTDANNAICTNNPEEMFVTVWLGILELSTGKLTSANAGHEYPAVMQNGEFELLKNKHGFVIGGMEGVRYKQFELFLKPGDKIFLYTDGVPEATDKNSELFGTDRMIIALNQNTSASPKETLSNVRAAVDAFVGDAEQFDDLTMLCLEYRGANAPNQAKSEA
jgi:serine phosphatase RsbU (regulator of sigma subunit)